MFILQELLQCLSAASCAAGKAGVAICCSPRGKGAVGAEDKARSAGVITTAQPPASPEPTVSTGASSITSSLNQVYGRQELSHR